MDGKKVLIILAILSVCLIFTPHASAEYKGKVVDAVTGKPIEGAVVLMYWGRECLPFGSGSFFDAEETLSDGSGIFEIEGHKINWNPLCSVEIPHFYIYKARYKAIDLAWVESVFKEEYMQKYLFFEGDLVVFKLQKTNTRKERQLAIPDQGPFPQKFQRLMIREINKENKALNLPLKEEINDASK